MQLNLYKPQSPIKDWKYYLSAEQLKRFNEAVFPKNMANRRSINGINSF